MLHLLYASVPTGCLPHVGAAPRVCPCIGGFPAVCAWRADTGVCPYAWLPLRAAFRPHRSKNCGIKCTKKAHPASQSAPNLIFGPPTDLIFPSKINGFLLYSPRFPSCCEDSRMSIGKCLFPIPYTMVWAKRGAISNCVFYLNRGSKARLMAILISSASVDP